MKREFQEAIGQYTEGDIHNYGIQLNVSSRADTRCLVPAQKQQLYELGQRCVELGADSKEIWRRVFAELGVKQIGDIQADQFAQARDVLQKRLDQLVDEDDKRVLVGKILRLATEKDARVELRNFCDIRFGRTHLNNLQRTELQRALEFMQRLQFKPLTDSSSPDPTRPLPFKEFLIVHKWNACKLVIGGILIGKYFL
ncbi:hypothetical protein [Pseudomonas japonica]|uniref:hypothetical protein n=1 Tax=Pseudomonas japonica TaxID=256466 RepID=UPI003A84A2F0